MGKLKVHELAKELGLESKELIKKAKEVGIEVTSHLSSLEEEQIQKIKNIFENKGVKSQKSMEQEKNKEKKDGQNVLTLLSVLNVDWKKTQCQQLRAARFSSFRFRLRLLINSMSDGLPYQWVCVL